MRFNNIALALALTGAAVATTANAARDTIQIAGSSTVLPYASIADGRIWQHIPTI